MKFRSTTTLAVAASIAFALDAHRGPITHRAVKRIARRDHIPRPSAPEAPAAAQAAPPAPAEGPDAAASAPAYGGTDSAAEEGGGSSDSSASVTGSVSSGGAYVGPAMAGGGGGGEGPSMDSCVQMCMAGGMFVPPAAATNASSPAPFANAVNGSLVASGPNQVIVAPKMGDLRMVPFAVSAKPGTTVSWEWGAGPHTVTQSSALEVCNKTNVGGAFLSGMKNASATFEVPVSSTDTIWYYCQVKMHCRMGMFGLINPPMAGQTNNSMQSAIDAMAAKNATMQKMVDDTKAITAANDRAAKWGAMFDTTRFPQDDDLMWASMKNTLLTRQFFAQNPTLLDSPTNADPSTAVNASSSAAGAVSTAGAGATNPSAQDSAAQVQGQASAGTRFAHEHETLVLLALGLMAALALV